VNKPVSAISRFLDIPATDPDDARRRKLLNFLLLFLVVLTPVATFASVIITATGLGPPPPNIILSLLSVPTALIGAGIIFAINRYWSGEVAGSIFLLVVTASAFAEPESATSGKMLLVFAIPVVIASFLLRPYASFILAGLISALIAAVRVGVLHAGLDVSLVPTFFLIALVSWVAARSLENALLRLRILNRELDQRVVERTKELTKRTQELAEALGKNRAILEGIADGVIVFDNEDKAIVANPAITDLLEQPADEIAGRSIKTLMESYVDAEDQEVILKLLRDRETQRSGLKVKWGEKTLSVSMAPVRDNYDRVTGTVAVFRDFTREAEIDRMKSTFVSIASHELRTPLNAIMGYTEMLQEGVYGDLTEQQRKAMERVVANTGHMLSLVNNLLDRARIEAGTLQLNIAPVLPSELVSDVLGVMDVIAQAKGLELNAYIAEDLPTRISGDRQRVHQVLTNLVGNAIKFTEEGSVNMRVYTPNASHWALEVSDTGCGIPEEAQSYIFEPFRQADDSATREYGGAGLGLSIVKQLVNLMGGEITLESEVNKGSTFTVSLPLAAEDIETLAPAQKESL